MLKRIHRERCEVFAPAKLNLFLEVASKRPDGYHELDTLMVNISLYDTLCFTLVKHGDVTLHNRWCSTSARQTGGHILPSGPDNLVLKAARLLAEETGTRHGAHIELTKRIPLAAGLAGGSSDAAATLVGLNDLWRLGLPAADLSRLGARLGSDVPFFLASASAAVCKGRGELIEPVQLGSTLHFVVVKPPAGLSTAQVFQNCRPAASPASSSELVNLLQAGDLDRAGRAMMNRLGEPAERLCDQVLELRRCFEKLPVCGHQMSGSGTSYFGICRNRQQAQRLASRLRVAGLGQVFAVHSGV